jgi:hypothetical protein
VAASRPRQMLPTMETGDSEEEEYIDAPISGNSKYSREIAEAVEDIDAILAEQSGWEALKVNDKAV